MAEIDRNRLATAALAVADERGAAGFTMRAVADKLGVTPMALYHHVADKAALVTLVVEAIISEQPLPAPTSVWQDDVWEIARWFRRSAQAHPNASRLHRNSYIVTPGMLPVTERWMSIWQQSGLPLDQALRAATAGSLAIYGYVECELQFQGTTVPDDAMFTWLPNARLLFGAEYDHEAEFELMVRALVDGLCARLTAPAALVRVEDWAREWAVEEMLGTPAHLLNDDRIGRALEALADQDEAVVGSIGATAIAAYGVECPRCTGT